VSFLTFVTMTPLGKGESVSQYVARVVDIIDKSKLPYVITPMGTIIEGETWDEVMDVLKLGFQGMKETCQRISMVIKVDYRKGRSGRIKTKVQSIEEKLSVDIAKRDD
jgi:uncharacterized protein (TIGR00106 family)